MGETQTSEQSLLEHVRKCEDEDIRIPGSIQQHGFLVVLDESQKHVVIASETSQEFLHKPIKLILGADVSALFDRQLLSAIDHLHCGIDPEGVVLYLGAFNIQGELLSVLTHCVDGRRVLEFERQDRLVGPEMMNAVITNFVGTLSKLKSEEELRESIVKQVADLTGFDRVLLYSFDEFGHGTVLNEHNNGKLPSYLDLRFPGTDIPKQARALYLTNTVRIIPDVSYAPSPLRAVSGMDTQGFNMSTCVLRSVSPVHVAYMRNMGTISSMSLSIVVDGQLWGLISGHHSAAHSVPYLVRSACDMLTKIVGTQISAFRTSAALRDTVHFHGVQHRLMTRIAATMNYLDTLEEQGEDLLAITEAAGIAIWVDERLTLHGTSPAKKDVQRIVAWLDTQPDMEVFASHDLSSVVPWADSIRDTASGLIAIRISDVRRRYILWFRPEIVETVKWAGDPTTTSQNPKSLEPRNSFTMWKEIVSGKSIEWTHMQTESAREFRAALMTISLRRAEEEAQLAEARFDQLTRSLPTKIFTANDHGQLTYVNQHWRDAGLPAGGIWYSDGRIFAEDEARCSESWSEAVRKGETFEEEVRFVMTNGEVRWNLVRAVPFKGLGAVRAGWVGMCADLTERKEKEAALRMAEKLAITGRMTSVIAHEINNPLEAITNIMFLLRHEVENASPAAKEYITMAENELHRIGGITKQTLRWTRENQESYAWIALDELFEEVLRLFMGKSRNRQVTIDTSVEPALKFYGRVGQIRQVVANLLSNAVDASRIGGKVQLSAKTLNESLIIAAQDHGIGMEEAQQAQLFKPFFSTKGDLGNGLGLYISHEIVERHGGRIEVETAKGQGTTMQVILPIRTPGTFSEELLPVS